MSDYTGVPGSPPPGDGGRPQPASDVERQLVAEVGHLSRLIAEQEHTVAEAIAEVRRQHVALAWRAQERFRKMAEPLLANRVLREPYRMARRAFEIWVDHGLWFVFRFAARKIGHWLRGRSIIVEDHEWTPRELDDNEYEIWLKYQAEKAEKAKQAKKAAERGDDDTDDETDDEDNGGDDADEAEEGEPNAAASVIEGPLVSVLLPFDATDLLPLRRTIETLQAQTYANWELCLALSPAAHAELTAAPETAAEGRLRMVVCATPTHGDALAAAHGEVLALLEPGDALAPVALVESVTRLSDDLTADVVYSDQDTIGASGKRTEPFFKPDWGPELLLATNYLGPFTVLRRRLVDELGGFRPEFGAGQVYDLLLRASEHTKGIAHMPKLLCHLRPRPTTLEAILARHAANRDERRAIEDALRRRGRPGHAEALFTPRGPRCYATRFDLARTPLVSIIIPTKNKVALLRTTIESILARTDYDAYEILVVDNGSTDVDAVEYLASLKPPCRVVEWPHPFNYSELNNVGVQRAHGDQLLFLNNDMEVIRPDWLRAMVEYAQFPDIGAVGAKLLYTDGSIQHAGVIVGINLTASHAFRLWPQEAFGTPRLADLQRDCSAVTGACMMVPRRVFEEVRGFDEKLRVVLNDIDLCLRIKERGYGVVYTPHALLYHHEGASRGRLHPPPDERRFQIRWAKLLSQVDPYYNPNLTNTRDDWSLRMD